MRSHLQTPNGEHIPMRLCSMVGLILLFSVETLEPRTIDRFGFQ